MLESRGGQQQIKLFGTECYIPGYIYRLHIYYCRKSFPVLLHDVMVGGCSWRPGAVDCTVWNERHRTRLAYRRPGEGADRDIELGDVPKQRGNHASRDQHERVSTRTATNITFRNRVVPWVGF